MVDEGEGEEEEGYNDNDNGDGDEDDNGGGGVLLGFCDSPEFQSLNSLITNSGSNPHQQQGGGGYENSIVVEVKSSLGLKLRKTPSFVSLIEKKLSESNKKQKTSEGNENQSSSSSSSNNNSSSQAKMDSFVSQPMSEKLKASNFPALAIQIGSWVRESKHEGDLTAKCYYAKRKLVWEVLEGALKSKIEMQWSDIVGIRADIRDKMPGILEIELNQPPSYFRETNPQPRKHTLWQQASDFTGGQAPIWRRHYAVFRSGYLDKHYEKLLQCDPRLLMLSQKPFPSQESPYFLKNIYDSLDFNRYGQQYRVRNFPNIPMPVMNFQHIIGNQGIDWNQGLGNNFARTDNEIGMSNSGYLGEDYNVTDSEGSAKRLHPNAGIQHIHTTFKNNSIMVPTNWNNSEHERHLTTHFGVSPYELQSQPSQNLPPYEEQLPPQLSQDSLPYEEPLLPQLSPQLPQLPPQLCQDSNSDIIRNESKLQPHQYSNTNMIIDPSYMEPSVEDYAILDATQDIPPWT